MKMFLKILVVNTLCGISLIALGEIASTSEGSPPLGRLFTSVDERQRLDIQRAAPPVANETVPRAVSNTDSPVRKQKSAAGYIVGPSGVRSAWSDGEFRPVENPAALQRMRFPGTIAIEVRELRPVPVPEVESLPDAQVSQEEPRAPTSTTSVSPNDAVQP